jgi:hypothetical protein
MENNFNKDGQLELTNRMHIIITNLFLSKVPIDFSENLIKLKEVNDKYEDYRLKLHFQELYKK